jgi:hypothetical protein
MKKNLIISSVGDKSLHYEWIKENNLNFDLILLYYGNDPNIIKRYSKHTNNIYQLIDGGKGKFINIQAFIQNNIELISNYERIWLPDDDVSINSNDINILFDLSKKYKLKIAQPSMNGYVSHEITKPIPNNLLHYTNFVEVLAPLFSLDTLIKIYKTFNLNYSSWGYDYLWPHILGYPKDKIAIIDAIIMTHTRPVGQNYDRFPRSPWEEMNELLHNFNIKKEEIIYSKIKLK